MKWRYLVIIIYLVIAKELFAITEVFYPIHRRYDNYRYKSDFSEFKKSPICHYNKFKLKEKTTIEQAFQNTQLIILLPYIEDVEHSVIYEFYDKYYNNDIFLGNYFDININLSLRKRKLNFSYEFDINFEKFNQSIIDLKNKILDTIYYERLYRIYKEK